MTQKFAVEVAYMIRRKIVVYANNEIQAAADAEKVVSAWAGVRSAKAVEVKPAHGKGVKVPQTS